MTCGIYALLFKNTEKVYIGQSLNIENRYSGHKYDFTNNSAPNKLQEAYNLYGMPSIHILKVCNICDLDTLEEEYIIEFDSVYKGFNTLNKPGGGTNICGEDSLLANFSNEEYESIFHILVECPDISYKEISEFIGVPKHIVLQISSGASHRWLQSKYPDKYEILLRLKNNRVEHSSPNSKASFTKEKYYEVMRLLIAGNKVKVVNTLTQVPIYTIKDIKNLHRHNWLEHAYPNEYQQLKQLKNKRK